MGNQDRVDPAMVDFVKPLIDKDAAQYAKEKGVTPTKCG